MWGIYKFLICPPNYFNLVAPDNECIIICVVHLYLLQSCCHTCVMGVPDPKIKVSECLWRPAIIIFVHSFRTDARLSRSIPSVMHVRTTWYYMSKVMKLTLFPCTCPLLKQSHNVQWIQVQHFTEENIRLSCPKPCWFHCIIDMAMAKEEKGVDSCVFWQTIELTIWVGNMRWTLSGHIPCWWYYQWWSRHPVQLHNWMVECHFFSVRDTSKLQASSSFAILLSFANLIFLPRGKSDIVN